MSIMFPRQGRAVSDRVAGNAVAMLSMLIWAAGFPAAEWLLQSWHPLALAAARLVVSVAGLAAVWVASDGIHAVVQARWRRATLVGGLGFGLGSYLILVAQSVSDPVTVAIIATTLPVVGAGLEVLLDRRRIRPTFVLGIVAAFVGGLIASGGSPGSGAGLGAMLALVSTVFFAWGSRAAIHEFPDCSMIGRTTITLAGGMVVVVALWLLGLTAGAEAMPPPLDARQIEVLAIYALAAMALSQLLWLIGVARLGISIASLHVNLAPFYVMLFMLALGGSWSWAKALGASIVAAGVVLAQWRS